MRLGLAVSFPNGPGFGSIPLMSKSIAITERDDDRTAEPRLLHFVHTPRLKAENFFFHRQKIRTQTLYSVAPLSSLTNCRFRAAIARAGSRHHLAPTCVSCSFEVLHIRRLTSNLIASSQKTSRQTSAKSKAVLIIRRRF